MSVLIVENEQIVAEHISDTLSSEGIHVCGTVASASEAVNAVAEHNPSVVLMDIDLEGESDGITAAHTISETSPAKIIYLSGLADRETVRRAQLTRPSAFLTKPFKNTDLLTTVTLGLLSSEEKVASEEDTSALPELSGEQKAALHVFKKIPSLKLLPERELYFLAQKTSSNRLERGEILVTENSQQLDGFILTSGRLSLSKSSHSGKELVVELIPPYDSFGLLATLEKENFPYIVRAQVGTELLFVPKRYLLSLLRRFPEAELELLTEVYARLRDSHDMSRMLAHEKVEIRVASALVSLVPNFSKQSRLENVECSVMMTRQELADLTGTTLETCVRVTKRMEKEGILDLHEPGLIRICSSERLSSMLSEA